MRPIRAITRSVPTWVLGVALLCGSTLHAAERSAAPALDLRPEQEAYLRHYARTVTPPAVQEPLTVGATLPFAVELHALPSAITVEVPAGRTLRFVTGPAGIAIVDPAERKVVQVLPPG